jgi:hypothetical protein
MQFYTKIFVESGVFDIVNDNWVSVIDLRRG